MRPMRRAAHGVPERVRDRGMAVRPVRRAARPRALPWAGAVLLAGALHAALALVPLPARPMTPATRSHVHPPPAVRVTLTRAAAPGAPRPSAAPWPSAAPDPETRPAPRLVPSARPDTAARIAPPARPRAAGPVPEQAAPPALPGPDAPESIPSVPDRGLEALAVPGLQDLDPVVPPHTAPGTEQAAWDPHAYGALVRLRMDAHKRYPRHARQLGQEGETVVAVRLRPDGSLAAPPRLVRSSGAAALDQEALRMARVAAPFPPPAGAPPRALVLHVPVRFSLAALGGPDGAP